MICRGLIPVKHEHCVVRVKEAHRPTFQHDWELHRSVRKSLAYRSMI